MKTEDNAFNRDIFLVKKFLAIKDQYSLDTVIETGTFKGSTTSWFCENFDNVYSVECNREYYEESKKNLERFKNLTLNLEESPNFLSKVLPKIDDKKTIIFLDAHWYTNPVLAELQNIKRSGKKPIIAIHDFMVPDHPEFGYDVYPNQGIVYNWEWIEKYIENIYGSNGYIKEYNTQATGSMRGCIFIFPK